MMRSVLAGGLAVVLAEQPQCTTEGAACGKGGQCTWIPGFDGIPILQCKKGKSHAAHPGHPVHPGQPQCTTEGAACGKGGQCTWVSGFDGIPSLECKKGKSHAPHPGHPVHPGQPQCTTDGAVCGVGRRCTWVAGFDGIPSLECKKTDLAQCRAEGDACGPGRQCSWVSGFDGIPSLECTKTKIPPERVSQKIEDIQLLSVEEGNSTPGAINVCNFGDSWAWLGQHELGNALRPYGAKLHTYAIPGAPVVFFAVTEPKALSRMIAERNCTHVVLSVGGDDFLEIEPRKGADPDVILAEMLANTDIILDKLFKEHPTVKVYQFGYEIMDWPASSYCSGYGYNLLHKVCPLGVTDVECCNKKFIHYIQTGYVDVLGVRYAGKHPYHAINLLGTLQHAGGVPGAEVGRPVLSKYSPSKYVIKAADPLGCVHLTPPGFNLVYKELAKRMFSNSSGTAVLV